MSQIRKSQRKMLIQKLTQLSLFKRYWFVLLVGAFFILTSLYHGFGNGREVFWNVFVKLTNEMMLISLLIGIKEKLSNTLSILTWFGLIAYVLSLSLTRIFCAIISKGDYIEYYELMKSDFLSLSLTFIIFAILVMIKYTHKK